MYINFFLNFCIFFLFISFFFFRRYILLLLIIIETILLLFNLQLVIYSIYLDILIGYIYVLSILSIAAAEAAIGLAIVVWFYRLKGGLSIDFISILKG